MNVITLPGHNNPVYAVCSHPSETLFYTAGNDKGVVEWDWALEKHTRVFKNLPATAYALEVIAEFFLLVAGCNNGDLVFYNLADGNIQQSINLGSAIFSLRFHPSKNELIASTDEGKIFIISVQEAKILYQFQSGNEKVRTVDFSDQLNYLVTASNDQTIRIFNLEDYAFIHQFEAHLHGVGAASFSPDGTKLITGGRDAHLRAWDTNSWSALYNFPAHLFPIYRIIYHPHLPYFATASRDKSIKIWRSEDFSLYRNLSKEKGLDGHALSVNQIAWTHDGSRLVSVGDDKMVKVWELF